MNKNYKAILIGTLIVVIAVIASLVVLYKNNESNIGFLMWGAVLVAGFSTAFKAKSHNIILALSVAAPTAIIFAIANWVWQLTGKSSDFPGAQGFITVIGMALQVALLLSGIGGLAGYWLRRKKHITT